MPPSVREGKRPHPDPKAAGGTRKGNERPVVKRSVALQLVDVLPTTRRARLQPQVSASIWSPHTHQLVPTLRTILACQVLQTPVKVFFLPPFSKCVLILRLGAGLVVDKVLPDRHVTALTL
jgi:hypothetical protein